MDSIRNINYKPTPHRLLKRQLKRTGGSVDKPPYRWKKFLNLISGAYLDSDRDRSMLERSLELSSNELMSTNIDLRAILDVLPDLFFRINKSNCIIAFKSGMDTPFSLNDANVLGKQISSINALSAFHNIENSLDRSRKCNKSLNLETKQVTENRTYYLEARITPLVGGEIIVIIRDVTARHYAENQLIVRDQRLSRQNEALVDLASNKTLGHTIFDVSLQNITEACAKATEVEMVGIWLFNNNRDRVICGDLYNIDGRLHTEGEEMLVENYPNYFKALNTDQLIIAEDAANDPRTYEFSKEILQPKNICSVLDAPIHVGGKIAGIVCFAHTGNPTTWSIEDKNFASSMADYVSLALEAREHNKAKTALRESDQRFHTLAETTGSPIFVSRDKFVYVNPALESLTGYSKTELLDMQFMNLAHSESLPALIEMRNSLSQRKTRPFRSEIRILTKDGFERWLDITSARIQFEGLPSIISSVFDITDRKQFEEQLKFQAFYDALTGLPNRALIINRIEQALARTRGEDKHRFAILYLDLDRFKVINDSLGHTVGDSLLIELAKRIQKVIRPADTAGRMGGDEFVILLEQIGSSDDVIDVAERVTEELRRPFSLADQNIFSNASIGIAISNPSYKKPEQMLRDADIAMYRAKATSQKCFVIFNESMHSRAVDLHNLETSLHNAMKNYEFELHYQPIIWLDTLELQGFEALLRWRHSKDGYIPPSDFIPLAEETGMILPIGNWVMREAIRQLGKWQRYPNIRTLSMGINLSQKQLVHGNIGNDISRFIVQENLPFESIKLEITESMLMERTSSANTVLNKLKEKGISIVVDDFGTGYSSLSVLHTLPINTLKIDRSFVDHIGNGTSEESIVATIVDLSKQLGFDMVAEGIETKEQLNHLRQLGCEKGQGFIIAKPLNISQVESLLSSQMKNSCINVAGF